MSFICHHRFLISHLESAVFGKEFVDFADDLLGGLLLLPGDAQSLLDEHFRFPFVLQMLDSRDESLRQRLPAFVFLLHRRHLETSAIAVVAVVGVGGERLEGSRELYVRHRRHCLFF